MRLTEVQQPNTTATLSFWISSRAFSANSGQLEAGSTTTGSSFLPRMPPFLFCSAMSISITSLSVVSLIAIVPDSECRMPTLIVSSAALAGVPGRARLAVSTAAAAPARQVRLEIIACLRKVSAIHRNVHCKPRAKWAGPAKVVFFQADSSSTRICRLFEQHVG